MDAAAARRAIDWNFTRAVWTRATPPDEQAGATRCGAEAARLREALGGPVEARALPELAREEVTPASVAEATQGYRRPVVLRGWMREAEAVRSWSREGLRARCGGSPCVAFRMGPEGTLSARGVEPVDLDLASFLDRMGSERLYINNATELFVHDPSLIDELDLERIEGALSDGSGWLGEFFNTQMFIGGPHVHTRLHCAPAGNAFVQIAGRKRWTLIDPMYSAMLGPFPAHPFQYALSALVGYRVRRLRGGPMGDLARIPRFEVTLQPGDLLYNTPWWWHEVENLDDFTVGCATRHAPQPFRWRANWRNHTLFTLLSVWPLRRAEWLALAAGAWLLRRDLPLLKIANWGTSRRLRRSFGGGA